MPRLFARRAGGIDDLRTATGLLAAAWRGGSRLVAGTPAAVEWWYALTYPDPLGDHLRLWYQDDPGQPVAWSWHEPPELEWHVWTGSPEHDRAIFRAIVETAIEEAGDAEVGAFAAADDVGAIDVLESLDFRPGGRRLSQWLRRAEDGPTPTPAPLPDGYRIRGLTGPDEFGARVALHRAAFPSSALSVAKYERLLTCPHYRLEDDLVAESPDGTLAAYALGWWDPDGAVAEFEPVGTHPDHQRRCLSRALLTASLARFLERGARTIQVYADASEEAAEGLYASAGFHRRAYHQRYARRPAGASDATIDA
jgi:ribosomal protein S18 acetylase RimI-like enzyme